MVKKEVEVLVPGIKDINLIEIGAEPWKYETPIYAVGNKLISVYCENILYFMTDEAEALKTELKKYGLLPPAADQYSPNPALNHATRLKMLELGAKWSVTRYHGEIIVNYYTKEDGAFIARGEKWV